MSQISSRVERKRQKRKERNQKLSFWVAQTILAGIFFLQGVMKLIIPVEALAQTHFWINVAPEWFVKLIGLIEVLAGLGLILPATLQYHPAWSMRAGYGVLLLLILATVFHIIRGEWSNLPTIVILAAIDVYFLWGRLKVDPIREKIPGKQ
jgi:putative oxidoreductase